MVVARVLVFALLVAACAVQTGPDFDRRLGEMGGGDERALLAAMGCIPDNSYQLDDETRILQWRWDTSYIAGGWAPAYRRVGGLWVPMGGFPPTLVRQGCIVEWTLSRGRTQSYRWQGSGCSAALLHGAP